MQQLDSGLVEEPVSVPAEVHWHQLVVAARVTLFDDDFDGPEVLGDEALNGVPPLHNEAQGGELTRPIADDVCVEAVELALDAHRQETGERRTDAQVDLLSCVDGIGHILVRIDEVAHRTVDVGVRDGRELRAPDGQPRIGIGADLDHLKTDVLPLPVAVEPQDEVRAPPRLHLQVPGDARVVLGHTLLYRRIVQSARVDALPVSILLGEVDLHHVTSDRRDDHPAAAVVEGNERLELTHGIIPALAVQGVDLS
mmetsp:Transcript_8842/g.25486  ORF Transcript_8842/g.25486 Transcript_8842/m.25486 type:complete len:254 (-) Transcript_8842:258-1019(-)